MKYLLEQTINYRQKEWLVKIYPNQFSSQFIKLANKKGLIIDTERVKKGKYYQVQSYLMFEKHLKYIYRIWKKQILKKREKFYRKPFLDQLILILKYIFNRNNRAKDKIKYYAKHKAYDDKSEFLRLALEIAAKIDHKDFSYGFQLDPAQEYFPIIYYFQLGEKQISFHSEDYYEDVPLFKGQWIGYRNDSFPFQLKAK